MCTKFLPNRSTDGQDDATFEGNSRLPKLKGRRLQGGAGALSVGWVDLDLECSTILLGQ